MATDIEKKQIRERVAKMRSDLGLDADGASDDVWVRRISGGSHDFSDAREALRGKAQSKGIAINPRSDAHLEQIGAAPKDSQFESRDERLERIAQIRENRGLPANPDDDKALEREGRDMGSIRTELTNRARNSLGMETISQSAAATPSPAQSQATDRRETKAGQSNSAIPASPASYQGASVVDYLNSQGEDSSYAARKELARQRGIGNYSGTAEQNTQLLNSLRGGIGASASNMETFRQHERDVANDSSSTGYASEADRARQAGQLPTSTSGNGNAASSNMETFRQREREAANASSRSKTNNTNSSNSDEIGVARNSSGSFMAARPLEEHEINAQSPTRSGEVPNQTTSNVSDTSTNRVGRIANPTPPPYRSAASIRQTGNVLESSSASKWIHGGNALVSGGTSKPSSATAQYGFMPGNFN